MFGITIDVNMACIEDYVSKNGLSIDEAINRATKAVIGLDPLIRRYISF